MGILRNGILRKFGKEPEKVIQEMMAGKVSGIGVVTDVISFVIKAIQFISKLVGKKGPDVDAKDAPDPASDFAELGGSDMQNLGREIRNQRGDDLLDDDLDRGASSGGRRAKGWC